MSTKQPAPDQPQNIAEVGDKKASMIPARSLIRNLFLSGLPIRYFWPTSRLPFAFVEEILADGSLNMVDFGARGDVQPCWLPLDGMADIYAFEPDASAVGEMKRNFDSRGNGSRYHIICKGAAGTSGPRTLYMSNAASGASVLPMKGRTWREYGGGEHDSALSIDIETVEPVMALAEVGCEWVHFVKADIQGLELEVLNAMAGPYKETLLGLEFEVLVQPDGIRPSLLDNLHFLEDRGFDIFDVRTHRAPLTGPIGSFYHEDLGVIRPCHSVSEKIWEFDIVAFRRLDTVIDSGDAKLVRNYIALLCAYNYFGEALHATQTARTLLGAAEAEAIRRAILDWHRILRKPAFAGPKRLIASWRMLSKAFKLGDSLRWARSQWVGFPSA